jgi:DNA invertase Pin-like site-specific DNA recombinase
LAGHGAGKSRSGRARYRRDVRAICRLSGRCRDALRSSFGADACQIDEAPGYARTSTVEQEAGLDAQVRDLKAAGCNKIFSERTSSVGKRSELEKALDYLRDGDTLVVCKVDRLARSTMALWQLVERLDAEGVGLRILNLGGETVDTKSATGRLILTIFAGFAQFEREIMLERQREGIAKAKAEGRYRGRTPSARAHRGEIERLHAEGKTVTEIARAVGISRGSVYNYLGR